MCFPANFEKIFQNSLVPCQVVKEFLGVALIKVFFHSSLDKNVICQILLVKSLCYHEILSVVRINILPN